MSKLLILFLLAVVALAAYVGIIEIKFHPEKVLGLKELGNYLLNDKTARASARTTFISIKRRGEFMIVRDEEKKLTLALTYVKADALSLSELLTNNAPSAEVGTQGKLLLSSLKLARKTVDKVSVNVVVRLKQESLDSFAAAHNALVSLQAANTAAEAANQEMVDLSSELANEIGVTPTPSPEATSQP